MGKDECSNAQRHPENQWKPVVEHFWPQKGAIVHHSAWQRHDTHSQDMKGVASGQLCECPPVAQPGIRLQSDQTSLEISNRLCTVDPHLMMEHERCCKEDWTKLLKDRCTKLFPLYPKVLEAVTAAKDV